VLELVAYKSADFKMSEFMQKLDIGVLPARQKDVLKLIVCLTEEHGYPPTLAELAKAMGLKNRMTVHQHVQALKKKGFVHWEPGLNRSLRVMGGAQEEFSQHSHHDAHSENGDEAPTGIPLAGAIAAGRPIDALGSDEYLDINNDYGKTCFALKVKGDSMIEDGIFDGDFVIVKPNPSPRDGEVVVALLEDGSATLKRFFKEKGKFRLQPGNSNYAPIELDASHDLAIQGVVVGLYRKM
jgi:repressor LexA